MLISMNWPEKWMFGFSLAPKAHTPRKEGTSSPPHLLTCSQYKADKESDDDV